MDTNPTRHDVFLSGMPIAELVAILLAIDPFAVGGIALRARPGPQREAWLETVATLLGSERPSKRAPAYIAEDRLIGGIDLSATLALGRAVGERGLLSEADLGIVSISSAERLERATAAHFCAALDQGSIHLERDGLSSINSARIGVVAIDESIGEDEHLNEALLDRLAFRLDLDSVTFHPPEHMEDLCRALQAARDRVAQITIKDDAIEALCSASLALGIGSVRAVILAVRTARHCAAFAGRSGVSEEDLQLAAALVLAPRATQVPADASQPEEQAGDDPNEAQDNSLSDEDQPPQTPTTLEDIVLAAASATLPKGILKNSSDETTARRAADGRQGALKQSVGRGRPCGARPGKPSAGQRLDILETLRAAAPWQKLRAAAHATSVASAPGPTPKRLFVRGSDFRLRHRKHHSQTSTIFLVDGSGSSALHRLAEAKGAVELLLSECYVRRDRVALIAFRGRSAETLLPPTRALARARRALAALPGGGATPLASGLDEARALGILERKLGASPSVVILTDGKGNVARDGLRGRASGEADAIKAGGQFRSSGLRALLIDTSPQRNLQAQTLANAMGARYLALPHADARTLSRAIRRSTLV